MHPIPEVLHPPGEPIHGIVSSSLVNAESLDVTIRPGGPDIVPEQVVASGGAQFGIDWLPSLLAARDQGAPLVNIAQIFAASGMRELAFKSSGIKGLADLKGRKVAVWFGGNEFELLATLEKYKLDRDKDVTLVPQPFDMHLLLQSRSCARRPAALDAMGTAPPPAGGRDAAHLTRPCGRVAGAVLPMPFHRVADCHTARWSAHARYPPS